MITWCESSGRWGVRLLAREVGEAVRELAVKCDNIIVVHAAHAHPSGVNT